jgi:hypothetical protein
MNSYVYTVTYGMYNMNFNGSKDTNTGLIIRLRKAVFYISAVITLFEICKLREHQVR